MRSFRVYSSKNNIRNLANLRDIRRSCGRKCSLVRDTAMKPPVQKGSLRHRSHGPKGRPEVGALTSAEAFCSLGGEWESLIRASASRNIFLTWEWISTWWQVFGSRLEPWILHARDPSSGQLAGIAPFVLRQHPFRPYRELSFLGNTVGSADHLDVLSRVEDEDAVSNAFAEFLVSHQNRWDVLRLDGMACESRLVSLLRQKGRRTIVRESVCPFLRLPPGREAFLALLDGNVRANLRRRAKRLQEDTGDAVQYERVSCAGQLPAALEDLFRLHQHLRAERGERGAFRDPVLRDFHHRLSERFLSRNWLRLYLLKANGRAIAAAYCFHYEDTVYFYQTGYDRGWARYGPGKEIIAHAISRAIEEGAHEFDFLRGAEPYKSQWTATARRDLRLALATTRRGSTLLYATRMARKVRDRLRSWRRRASGLPDLADDPGLFM